MIKAIKDNYKIRCIQFEFPQEQKDLRAALTFKVPNYWFSTAYKRGGWDGTTTFFNGYSNTFPTGMLHTLPQAIQDSFVIVDQRAKPTVHVKPLALAGVELRDYQKEMIERAVVAERAILTAPTNAGKTEIGCGLMQMLPCKTLWLTHRGNLLYQTAERIEKRLGERVGIVGGGKSVEGERITVGMVQTIYSGLKSLDAKVKSDWCKWLEAFEMLIVDECHHQAAGSWYRIANKCNAYFRYGLSATPLRNDEISNMKLIAVTGEEIKTVTNRDLIEAGHSAKPVIYRVKNQCLPYVKTHSYRASYLMGIVQNSGRNRIIAQLMHTHHLKKEPVLVLVTEIEQGRSVCEMFSQYGVNAQWVDGGTDYEQRNVFLRQLEAGVIPAIVATAIFDEGADVPNIRVLILGGGGCSPIQLLQRIGRGMRKKQEGENKVIVYDFEDSGDRYLSKHSLSRFQLYLEEGFEVIPLQVETELTGGING